MVISVDRGRWGCVLESGTGQLVTAMRARELGRTPIVVGDRVSVVGDRSGQPGTLARIVRLEERSSVLRRTADDTDPFERIVVANATQLLIVVAAAEPTPRTGFVERALIAAYAGGIAPILGVTKGDIADASSFAAHFAGLDLPIVQCGIADSLEVLSDLLDGEITALLGHSGVGKSTLVNRIVPDADRATGAVTGVGKGRHTSSQSVALKLPGHDHSSWVIDTPGVRSFGLAHISADDVLDAFADLMDAVEECPRGCGHLGAPEDPECALDELESASYARAMAVRRLLAALRTNEAW